MDQGLLYFRSDGKAISIGVVQDIGRDACVADDEEIQYDKEMGSQETLVEWAAWRKDRIETEGEQLGEGEQIRWKGIR